jgi:hypothetical protein
VIPDFATVNTASGEIKGDRTGSYRGKKERREMGEKERGENH